MRRKEPQGLEERERGKRREEGTERGRGGKTRRKNKKVYLTAV